MKVINFILVVAIIVMVALAALHLLAEHDGQMPPFGSDLPEQADPAGPSAPETTE